VVDAVADLCEAAPRQRSTAADAALAQAILPFVIEAEQEVRQRLAERLSEADWAPHDLVAVLALDEIDVARPLIAHSPVLTEADLLRLLRHADVAHRIEVARRPALSEDVAWSAANDAEPLVLTALASNEHTKLPPRALERLIDAARSTSALRGPLARRRELDPDLAVQLYAFVGEGLRKTLSTRFDLPADRLAEAVSHAVADAGAKDGGERSHMEQRLVSKLSSSGQLRPSFLIKSLRDGRLGLFEEALSALSGLPRAAVAASLRETTAEPLALACAAAGLDRGAFPTLLTLVQRETGGAPASDSESLLWVKNAFAHSPSDAAHRALVLLGGPA
jgi:uncharacterized protein (DUF2336 family)